MTISKDQKRTPKGTPESANNHRFRRHNVLQAAKRLMSKYGKS